MGIRIECEKSSLVVVTHDIQQQERKASLEVVSAIYMVGRGNKKKMPNKLRDDAL